MLLEQLCLAKIVRTSPYHGCKKPILFQYEFSYNPDSPNVYNSKGYIGNSSMVLLNKNKNSHLGPAISNPINTYNTEA